MRRIAILRLASVAALALIPLACNDLGTGPDYGSDASQDSSALTNMLRVDPDVATLDVGDVLQLEATIRQRFKPFRGGDPLTWESSDPSVAAVDGEGRVQALGPGEATITVRYWQYEADVMIQVITPYDDGWVDNR
jgi:hypothetical protein